MFYVTKDLLKKLSPEDQDLVKDEGLTMEQMDAMSPEEKEKLMDDSGSDVQAPDTNEVPGDDENPDLTEKADDETKLPKPTKFGDEDQYEAKLTDDGRMEELPNSKKNAIGSFDDAAEQGMALLDKVSKMPGKKKPMPKKKAKDEGSDDESDNSDEGEPGFR